MSCVGLSVNIARQIRQPPPGFLHAAACPVERDDPAPHRSPSGGLATATISYPPAQIATFASMSGGASGPPSMAAVSSAAAS